MVQVLPGGLVQRGDVAGQVENFGALVAAQQLASVLADGAPVLVRVFLWLRLLLRRQLLRWGLRTVVLGVRGRGQSGPFVLLPGLGFGSGAAVRQAGPNAGLHLKKQQRRREENDESCDRFGSCEA